MPRVAPVPHSILRKPSLRSSSGNPYSLGEEKIALRKLDARWAQKIVGIHLKSPNLHVFGKEQKWALMPRASCCVHASQHDAVGSVTIITRHIAPLIRLIRIPSSKMLSNLFQLHPPAFDTTLGLAGVVACQTAGSSTSETILGGF